MLTVDFLGRVGWWWSACRQRLVVGARPVSARRLSTPASAMSEVSWAAVFRAEVGAVPSADLPPPVRGRSVESMERGSGSTRVDARRGVE